MGLWKPAKGPLSGSLPALVGIVLVAGLADATVMATLTSGAQYAALHRRASVSHAALLGLAVVAFVVCKRWSFLRASVLVGDYVAGMRQRLLQLVVGSDLETVERLGRARLYNAISRQTTQLADAAGPLTNAAAAVFMLLFAALYLVGESQEVLLAAVVCVGLGFGVYHRSRREIGRQLAAAADQEARQLEGMRQLFRGAKELRLDRERSEQFFKRAIEESTEAARDSKIAAHYQLVDNGLFYENFYFCLVAFVVFVLPAYVAMPPWAVLKLTGLTLFLMAPLESVLQAVPLATGARATQRALAALEEELRVSFQTEVVPAKVPWSADWQKISLDYVSYHHPGDSNGPGFSIGPLQLSVSRGETLFLVGGNGSGKSTLLKVLGGLYGPQSGALAIDGKTIGANLLPAYRNLFSSVFTDFHLFDRLYGIEVDEGRSDVLLAGLGLLHKTRLDGDRFTTAALSTGQRKRLALVTACLEDRAIIILDEWAADQDPEFRAFFYEAIQPDLKQRGKTVVLATHDERWFHVADRVIHMDLGQITQSTLGRAL